MPHLWTLLLFPAAISAITFDCAHVQADKQTFNFKELGGPRTVHQLERTPPTISNTTFTIDICSELPRDKDKDKKDQCQRGTRVCGVEEAYEDGVGHVVEVIPIAGQYFDTNGRSLDPKIIRTNDKITLELHGGKYPNLRSGQKQKALIDFICDPNLTGNEGFKVEDVTVDDTSYGNMRRIEEKEHDGGEDDGDDEPLDNPFDKDKSLQLVSYKMEGDFKVLRVEWRTKWACEKAAEDNPEDKSRHWGFFTWALIVLFLLAAAYIVFGSWLNYNRYGARGWDLIPHGDMIRDLPYTIKDWVLDLVARVRGGGSSRGGYSAV